MNKSDNTAKYECKAENSATDIALYDHKILSVHCKLNTILKNNFETKKNINLSFILFFHLRVVPPDNIEIKIEPTELKPGDEATLTCISNASNPPAVITWWRDGIPILGPNTTISDGLFSSSSSSILKLNVTKEMDDEVITCQSSNEKLQQSVHEALTLQVLCEYF